MKRASLVACCVWLACPAPAAAHRLDEYLQATRIALAPDNVSVEIDLTPGVRVASQVAALIDVNGDGELSAAEQRAYAALVVGQAQLTVDGMPAPLVLLDSAYPAPDEMAGGTGSIRLRARATLSIASSPGRHELTYRNDHQPGSSAYLVNALAPPDAIRITDQRRDPTQHQLTLDYIVDAPYARAWRLGSGIGVATLMACTMGWFRRRRPPRI